MRIRLAFTLDIRRERPEPQPDRDSQVDSLVESSPQERYPLGFQPGEPTPLEDRRQ